MFKPAITCLHGCRTGVQTDASWESVVWHDSACPAHHDAWRLSGWADALDAQSPLVSCLSDLASLTSHVSVAECEPCSGGTGRTAFAGWLSRQCALPSLGLCMLRHTSQSSFWKVLQLCFALVLLDLPPIYTTSRNCLQICVCPSDTPA